MNFILLFCTHLLVLLIGWYMGTKVDSLKILPKNKVEEVSYIDDLDKERLDYE